MGLKTFLLFSCFFVSGICFNARAQDCDTCEVHVPNVLTPNCDGIDCHLLDVTSNCDFSAFNFQVMNRWGAVIFETKSPEEKFDCSDQTDGVYAWQLEATFCGRERKNMKGQLVIIK